MTLTSAGRARTSSPTGRTPNTMRPAPPTAALLGLVADGRGEIPVRLDLDDVVARIGEVDLPLLLGRTRGGDRRRRQQRRAGRDQPRAQGLPLRPRQDHPEVALALRLG